MNRGALDPATIKDLIVQSLDDDKAVDIEIIDLNGHSALADYIVVASGTSTRQTVRMAEKLKERLAARGCRTMRSEGMNPGDWVILDTGDVIVHLFRPEVRQFYNIEEMWSMNLPETAGPTGLQLA